MDMEILLGMQVRVPFICWGCVGCKKCVRSLYCNLALLQSLFSFSPRFRTEFYWHTYKLTVLLHAILE
jgi:hypothetical protein